MNSACLPLSHLLSVGPFALVLASICPGISAEPMFLVILVVSFVTTSIAPCIQAFSMHVIVQPLTLKSQEIICQLVVRPLDAPSVGRAYLELPPVEPSVGALT